MKKILFTIITAVGLLVCQNLIFGMEEKPLQYYPSNQQYAFYCCTTVQDIVRQHLDQAYHLMFTKLLKDFNIEQAYFKLLQSPYIYKNMQLQENQKRHKLSNTMVPLQVYAVVWHLLQQKNYDPRAIFVLANDNEKSPISAFGSNTLIINQNLCKKSSLEEFEVMILHEIQHLKNQDTLVSGILYYIPCTISMPSHIYHHYLTRVNLLMKFQEMRADMLAIADEKKHALAMNKQFLYLTHVTDSFTHPIPSTRAGYSQLIADMQVYQERGLSVDKFLPYLDKYIYMYTS